jgi:hypothetical protein
MVQGAIGNQVQQMLHAGDVATALEHLGVKGQTTKDLISAVTHTLQKDLENLRKTYTYKAGLDYSTAKAKEEALTALTEKIKQKEASIQSLKERIEGLGSDMCPICYDDPNEPLITPCCSHVFCATCLLMSLARNPDCPLCRGKVAPAACTKLLPSDAAVTNQIVEEGRA